LIAVRICSSFFEYTRVLERIRAEHTTIREAKGTEEHERHYEVYNEHIRHREALRRSRVRQLSSVFQREQALQDIEKHLGYSSPRADDCQELGEN